MSSCRFCGTPATGTEKACRKCNRPLPEPASPEVPKVPEVPKFRPTPAISSAAKFGRWKVRAALLLALFASPWLIRILFFASEHRSPATVVSSPTTATYQMPASAVNHPVTPESTPNAEQPSTGNPAASAATDTTKNVQPDSAAQPEDASATNETENASRTAQSEEQTRPSSPITAPRASAASDSVSGTNQESVPQRPAPSAAPVAIRTETAPQQMLQPAVIKPSQPVTVSESVSQRLLVRQVQPVYPMSALQAHVEGDVLLAARISTSGDVVGLSLLSGQPLFTNAAAQAVRQWKYNPYLSSGEPVEMITGITVHFRLPAEAATPTAATYPRQPMNGPQANTQVYPAAPPSAPGPAVRFQVQLFHRHGFTGLPGGTMTNEPGCYGIFEALSDGTAHFDCRVTRDATGRCDHVTFEAGSLKEVKLKKDGSLHVATLHRGNYDFSGRSVDVQKAYEAISGPDQASSTH